MSVDTFLRKLLEDFNSLEKDPHTALYQNSRKAAKYQLMLVVLVNSMTKVIDENGIVTGYMIDRFDLAKNDPDNITKIEIEKLMKDDFEEKDARKTLLE